MYWCIGLSMSLRWFSCVLFFVLSQQETDASKRLLLDASFAHIYSSIARKLTRNRFADAIRAVWDVSPREFVSRAERSRNARKLISCTELFPVYIQGLPKRPPSALRRQRMDITLGVAHLSILRSYLWKATVCQYSACQKSRS